MIKTNVLFLILLPGIFACSATRDHASDLDIPSYAGPGDEFDEFIVTCGNVRSSVRGRVENLFYTEEGEMKTREEFCSEESVSTRIR